MTVKFSSLHIKRKSLLAFPQTGMAEHLLRVRKRCRNVLKTQKYFMFQTLYKEMKVLNQALVYRTLFESWAETKLYLLWILGTRWLQKSVLGTKTIQRELYRFGWVLQVWLCCVSTLVFVLTLRADTTSQPQDLNPASSSSHSVQLNDSHLSFACHCCFKNVLRQFTLSQVQVRFGWKLSCFRLFCPENNLKMSDLTSQALLHSSSTN